MRTLDRVLTQVENWLAAGALALAALISIVNIIIRQFGAAFFWVEESVIYLIIFSTFLGAVITLRHNEHVSVDIVGVFLKERGKKWLALIGGLVTLAYLGIMGWLGWMLLLEPFSRSTVTPVLKLPLWVVELAVPLGMTLMFLRMIVILGKIWRGETEDDDPESVLAAEASATGLALEEIRASKAAIEGSGAELTDLVLDEDGQNAARAERAAERPDERPDETKGGSDR